MTMALDRSGDCLPEFLASSGVGAPLEIELEPLHSGRRAFIMRGSSLLAVPVKELEFVSVVALGDDPEVAAQEYVHLDDASFLLATYEDDELENQSDFPLKPSAEIRFTPHSLMHGIITLNDLVDIKSQPGQSLEEVLELIQHNFAEGIFDITKMWDITTFGVSEDYAKERRRIMRITETVLGALLQVGFQAHNSGNLDYCVSINEVGTYKTLQHFGLPYRNLDPYAPEGFLYDTVGDDLGMIGVAGWLDVAELMGRARMASDAKREQRDLPKGFGTRCGKFLGAVYDKYV